MTGLMIMTPSTTTIPTGLLITATDQEYITNCQLLGIEPQPDVEPGASARLYQRWMRGKEAVAVAVGEYMFEEEPLELAEMYLAGQDFLARQMLQDGG